MREINERNIVGETALFTAVAYDKTEAAKRLLEKDADPNISDNNGTTTLMNAASVNNETMVKLLLSYGANPHLKDNFGDSAAVYARKQGHEQLAVFFENLKQEGK